jgi:hypothetical protein
MAFRRAVRYTDTELLEYRPELSYVPEPK